MTKEQITWNFADKYYTYLNRKLQYIDMYLQNDYYKQAMNEIEQIFIHINGEILIKNPEKYKEFITRFKKVKNNVESFEMQILKQDIPLEHKQIKTSRMKRLASDSVKEIYMEIMKMISELGMFFPKTQKDERLPIYQD